jgi:hypothetical protein
MGDLTAEEVAEEEVAALRSAANAAADVIVETAITAGGRSTWLGATVGWADGTPVVAHRTGDPSLYEGSAGIGIKRFDAAFFFDCNAAKQIQVEDMRILSFGFSLRRKN